MFYDFGSDSPRFFLVRKMQNGNVKFVRERPSRLIDSWRNKQDDNHKQPLDMSIWWQRIIFFFISHLIDVTFVALCLVEKNLMILNPIHFTR